MIKWPINIDINFVKNTTFICSCLAMSCCSEVGGRPGIPWPARESSPAAELGGKPGIPARAGGRPGAPGGPPGRPPGPPAACWKYKNIKQYKKNKKINEVDWKPTKEQIYKFILERNPALTTLVHLTWIRFGNNSTLINNRNIISVIISFTLFTN